MPANEGVFEQRDAGNMNALRCLAISVIWFLGCTAGLSAPVCKPDLFSLNSGRNCADASQKPEGGLHAMYSKIDAVQLNRNAGESVIGLETTMLTSENEQLSSFGPDAAATFSLACGSRAGLILKLDFPGYPVLSDDEFPVTFSFGNNWKLALAARMGRNFSEILVSSRQDLHNFWSTVRRYKNLETSVSLTDSDGTSVRANFIFAKIFDEMESVVGACG